MEIYIKANKAGKSTNKLVLIYFASNKSESTPFKSAIMLNDTPYVIIDNDIGWE